jgi:hypothetical protein
MNTPTLEQLERALHIRGAIEALQAELATVFNGLAKAVAPEPGTDDETEPKGPFADSYDGARARRLNRKRKEGKISRKPTATSPTRRRRKSRRKSRLWAVLTGGEVETPPVATEAKSHGRASRKTSQRKKGRKPPSARRKRSRKTAKR